MLCFSLNVFPNEKYEEISVVLLLHTGKHKIKTAYLRQIVFGLLSKGIKDKALQV